MATSIQQSQSWATRLMRRILQTLLVLTVVLVALAVLFLIVYGIGIHHHHSNTNHGAMTVFIPVL
ncbi:MAG: hypothetical protein ACR2JC_06065 [Chloroflexota bacterium]|nr:MAG: hypothetical protein DLM70_03745 [Chloroflexota bacterium]